jgi:hypothetical protein
MNFKDANQVLNNVKYGLFEPSYKVTQALMITGDLNENKWITDKLLRCGFLDDQDREKITPPYATGPFGEGY